MSRKPTRDRWHRRTGKKQIGRGRDSDWLIEIYRKFGAQRFVYSDAKEMILEVLNENLPQTTLGAWVRWGWVDAVDETMERRPRIVYQIPDGVRKTLEAIVTGQPRPVRTLKQPIPFHISMEPLEWDAPWKVDWRGGRR